jgi:hypothetical protein
MINILGLRVAGMWYECRRRFEVSFQLHTSEDPTVRTKKPNLQTWSFEFLVKRVGSGQSVSVHVRSMFLESGDMMLRSRWVPRSRRSV